MKIKAVILLLFCALLFCACSESENKQEVSEIVSENTVPEENEGETKEVIKDDIKEDIKDDIKQQTPEILSAKESFSKIYELHPDCSEIIAKTEYSCIYLDESKKEEYPALYETLLQYANMATRACNDGFDNLCAFAIESFENDDSGMFRAYYLKLAHSVRRADSIVFSVIEDTYTDYMDMEPYRGIYGMNFDSVTGELIPFSDVVKDKDGLVSAINEEIHSGMWTGNLYSDMAVKDYFDRTSSEDVSYTIEYYGVTVYFNHGEICDYMYGVVPVTLSFSEYPDLFDEKYMAVPESYSVGLAMGISNFIDIDGDGKQDELILTEYKDEEYDFYTELNIITSAGNYYAEDYYAYGFSPYYIKTADNRHLLYVFSHDADDFDRLMRLNAYEITDGSIFKLGEMPVAPSHDNLYEGEDIFSLPLNPDKMYFDFFNEAADFVYPVFTDNFEIASNGLPKKIGEDEEFPAPPEFDVENFEEYEYTSDDVLDSVWYGYRFVDGITGIPRDCSEDAMSPDFVKLEFFNDGRGLIKLFGGYNDFTWGEDTHTSISMNFNDGFSYYPYFYTDNNGNLWMFIQVNEDILWMYKK